MKRKNPYILASIIYMIATILNLVNVVLQFYGGNLLTVIIFVVGTIFWAFATGILCRKALKVAETNAELKQLRELIEDNEPFKEFDVSNEIQNKEN